jgi:NADH-quinone oxidoreductase subunit C
MHDASQMDALAPVHASVAAASPSAVVTTTTPLVGETQVMVEVPRDDYVAVVQAAKDTGFTTFIDLCAIDHLGREPRFDVVVNLLSTEFRERILIKVALPAEDPTVPTISPVFTGADFYEREVWDMFGLVFTGHPDLSRILMPDEWEGHPLRKDFRVGDIPVEFKEVGR